MIFSLDAIDDDERLRCCRLLLPLDVATAAARLMLRHYGHARCYAASYGATLSFAAPLRRHMRYGCLPCCHATLPLLAMSQPILYYRAAIFRDAAAAPMITLEVCRLPCLPI